MEEYFWVGEGSNSTVLSSNFSSKYFKLLLELCSESKFEEKK